MGGCAAWVINSGNGVLDSNGPADSNSHSSIERETVKPQGPPAWTTEDNSTMAYIMMEDFVTSKLKSPASADFPGAFDGRADHVKKLPGNKYIISSYVDAQNSFGANIRTKFAGVIVQISKDNWRLESLELVE